MAEHKEFVDMMLEKAKKKDPEPKPENLSSVDKKEVEKLAEEIRKGRKF